MNKIVYWTKIIIFVLFCFNFFSFAKSPKKVFIIHSYGPDNITALPQHQGLMEALSKYPKPLIIKTFYMCTKSKYTTPSQIKERGEMAIDEMKRFHPDVVVVVDDNACREVMFKFVDTKYKFVFTGMNTPPEEYNKKFRFMEKRERPGHNITGVYEKIYVISLINFMARTFKTLKKAFIFISTSPTGQGVKETILYEMKRIRPSVPTEIIVVSKLEEYKKKLQYINDNYSKETAMVIPLIDRLDSPSGTMTFKEVIPFTLKYNRLIEAAPGVPFLKMGVLAVIGPDYKKMGYQAGLKVYEILNRKSPSVIPIEESKECIIGFNLKRAKELRIKLPFEFFLSSNVVLGGEIVGQK